MENNRALGYLGLARRGGNIAIGEEPVGAQCRAGHARLLILAKDAADNTVRRAASFTAGGKPPVVKVPFTKDELGDALGCNACAMAALIDVALALAFVKALPEQGSHTALIETLEKQVERVVKRRKEEKAHRKNIRMGRKKPNRS
ncbi:MAG: 50S ribosomal protein L7 [Oscillospiraceae bacterium]|nr:50S ribosomal protein L7 [Oscillospiraceae bacterium]